MKLVFVLSSAFLLVGIEAGQISLCAKEKVAGVKTVLANANVVCWDEDSSDSDDWLAQGTTDSNGCVSLSYQPIYWPWWDNEPDIYCVVSKASYLTLYTETKKNHNQGNTAYFQATVYPDRVARGTVGTINGCGPQSLPDGFVDTINALLGFENECNNHDLCYNDCSETKETCDDEFADILKSRCEDLHDYGTFQKGTCLSVAAAMVGAVEVGGDSSFAAGRAVGNCEGQRLLRGE